MARNERTNESEVALSHPSKRIAVRLTDDGQVLIQAGDHAGIVVDEDGVITIFGSAIRFLSDDVLVNGTPVATKGELSFSEGDRTGEIMRIVSGARSD